MYYAIYKCMQCGKTIKIGLMENQIAGSILHAGNINEAKTKNRVASKITHDCNETTYGIATLCGVEANK